MGLGLGLGLGSCSKCPARAETRASAGRCVRAMLRKHPWPSAKESWGAASVPRAPWRCRPAHRHRSRRTRARRACRGGRAWSAPAVLAPWRAAAPPPRPRTRRESGQPAPTWNRNTSPIWQASAAHAVGWLRLAEARDGLKAACGEPACRVWATVCSTQARTESRMRNISSSRSWPGSMLTSTLTRVPMCPTLLPRQTRLV